MTMPINYLNFRNFTIRNKSFNDKCQPHDNEIFDKKER